MGVFKSKYYVGLSEDECAENDVETLHKAMRGLGTDEADLIRTLCFKNNDHLRRVNLLFEQKYGARGNLQKWIIDDTSGDFQKLMIAIAQEEAEMIADALYKAMKGLGTDDDLIINTLATRSPVEIERAAKVFERKYPGEDLRKWINDDTSGDYKKVLLALLDRKAYFCRELHKAISGLGTDDDQLIRMITSMKHHDEVKRIVSEFEDPLGFALDITTQLEMEFSTPTIREVAECYERMYGQSLKAALAGDTSGLYGKLILGLMEDQASRDADLLRKACAGAGTDDEALVSFLVTKGEKEREALGKAYVQKFGRTVADEIGSETSFNYKQVLTALAKPKAMVVAEALRKTMKGAGTDERALIYLLVHRSKKEIREIYKAYESLFQRDLIKDIESETFGWFQKCLVFMVRESIAERPRTHLPFSLMHLARDVDR